MIKTLVRTLHGANGNLFTIIDGRRLLLAECVPEVKIYEQSSPVKRLGAQGKGLKSIHIAFVLCKEKNLTREVDEAFFDTVDRFEFVWDVQIADGTFERIRFDNVVPDEVEMDGEWKFELVGQYDLARKLATL